ncbi:hypothetical protein ACWEPC_53860 [Nonomuraea sp. NPDC004297]
MANRVTILALLVVGVLAHHVRDGQEEQFALGVPCVAGAALVGAAGGDSFGLDRAGGGRMGGGDVELGHEKGELLL